MSLIALVITIGLSYFLAKTITGPIQQLIAKQIQSQREI